MDSIVKQVFPALFEDSPQTKWDRIADSGEVASWQFKNPRVDAYVIQEKSPVRGFRVVLVHRATDRNPTGLTEVGHYPGDDIKTLYAAIAHMEEAVDNF